MYGLVNQAVIDLAVTLGGEDLWRRIREQAGIDTPSFVALQAYDDEVTYRLVEAASAVLGISQEAVLEAFGEHWILYTGRQGYGPMLDAMGGSLPVFLRNLDAMHSRIALSMPDLHPPAFSCEELDDENLVLRYWSTRSGLAPMVRGLLKGLGVLFEQDVVVQTGLRGVEADHDTFLVQHRPIRSSTPEACPAAAQDESHLVRP